MKNSILASILVTLCGTGLFAQYPDLPGNGGNFNLQLMPAGSYVIAMDNRNQGSGSGSFSAVISNRSFNYTSGNPVLTAVTNTTGILVGMVVTGQAAIPAGATVTAVTATTVTISAAPTATANNKGLDFGNVLYSGADFNLRAYGLLVTLMNNNIKLKWVIKPGKAKDGIDFSVNASRVKPTAGAAVNMDFSAGPFVIFQQDTTGVGALVQAFNGAASADDVKLYKTNAPVSVDVRYDYSINGSVWRPKAAILNDGGNASIHQSYMVNAGVPASNYSIDLFPGLVTGCYTFASEPHNTSAPDAVIQAISDFVRFGGNFLAQCAAVRTYELSTLARFQSTNGFDNANENGDPATWTYSNADLSYFQINGYFGIADNGGSLKDWVIPTSPTNPPTNNFHYHTSGTANGRNYTNASVSKLRTSTQLGGMVYYLGSHSYNGADEHEVNGQRMYLNAFITPTNPQGALQSNAVIQCTRPNIMVQTSSVAGPAAAYPLTFTLYEDLAPAGYNAGDPQLGNVVTMTGPNTYLGGVSVISTPNPNFDKNYLVAIRPALNCFQAKYLTNNCISLSASLLSFTAARNSAVVTLKWTTGTEQNNRGFAIERMLGNGGWEEIGFVNSKAPGGSSNSELSYSYADMNLFKGISQYRLRQVDFDNQSKRSEIRAVKGEDQKTGKLVVFPNPSDGNLQVMLDNKNGSYDVVLNDMSGRMIKQWRAVTTNILRIENLMPGIYQLRVVNRETNEQVVEKVVVKK